MGEEWVLGDQVAAALKHRAEGTDEAEQLLKHLLRAVLPATHAYLIEFLALQSSSFRSSLAWHERTHEGKARRLVPPALSQPTLVG